MEKEPVEKKRGNTKNLIPANQRSKEEVRKNSAKGGRKSGEVRRQKRDLRLAIERLLEQDFVDKKTGEVLSGAELITLKQMEKAIKGDWRAFQLLRDTAGQKPVEKVMVSEVDQKTIDDVEDMMREDDEE